MTGKLLKIQANDFIKQIKEKEDSWVSFRKECFLKDKNYRERIKLVKKNTQVKVTKDEFKQYH